MITAPPEPSAQEINRLIQQLEAGWKSTVVIKRQALNDIGYREVYVSIDDSREQSLLEYGGTLTLEVPPGAHRLKAHNTLFTKTADFSVAPGEQVCFTAINRAGFGTYSALAFMIGFLGAGPFYLTLLQER